MQHNYSPPRMIDTYHCWEHKNYNMPNICCDKAKKNPRAQIEVFPGKFYTLGVYGYDNRPKERKYTHRTEKDFEETPVHYEIDETYSRTHIWLSRTGGSSGHLGGPYPGGITSLHEPILQDNSVYRIGTYVWEPYRGIYAKKWGNQNWSHISLNADYLYWPHTPNIFPYEELEQAKLYQISMIEKRLENYRNSEYDYWGDRDSPLYHAKEALRERGVFVEDNIRDTSPKTPNPDGEDDDD